jgi:hypothetical protein
VEKPWVRDKRLDLSQRCRVCGLVMLEHAEEDRLRK